MEQKKVELRKAQQQQPALSNLYARCLSLPSPLNEGVFYFKKMEKTVQLFSGGFDSTLQEFILKPDILLYVDMKTTYSEAELKFLKTLPESYQRRLVIKELPLGEYELKSMYLPYRNLILAAIALQYGQHVYFGFNNGDNAPDKDELFIKRLTTLFRHLNSEADVMMGWENKHFSFRSPFKHLTKTGMVKLALEEGMSPTVIQNIRSCYSATSEKGCGDCGPCVTKAIALINNDLFCPELFDTPITKAKIQKFLENVSEEPNLSETWLNDFNNGIQKIGSL